MEIMNALVKKLDAVDLDKFKDLISLFENVFKMEDLRMPDDNYLSRLLDGKSFLVFVAMIDEKVVGGLTAYTLQQYYSELPLIYIYDLAVRTEFQRQGIGKLLISAITDYGKVTGVEEVFVQADEEDGYALDFYKSTGATPEKVVHFYYPLNSNFPLE